MAMPSIRTEIKFFLIILFWVVFSAGYIRRFPLPGFLAQIYLFALAVVVTLSAFGYGSSLVKFCAPQELSTLEFVLFSTVAGFGLISLAMVVAGVLGFWTHGGAMGLVVVGLLLGWRHYKSRHAPRSSAGDLSLKDMMDPRQGLRHTMGGERLLCGAHSGMTALVPSFLILSGTILSLTIDFAPVTYYDSLVYHFALPQAYIQAGHWIGLQHLIYSAFPQNLEMIWTFGMLLAGDVLANLIGWIIAVLGVLSVYSFAKRYFDIRIAVWAAAFLSAMPAYLLLSSGGYIDVGLAVFSFMSFYVLCLWKDDPNPRLLAFAGVLAGYAVGTKYTGAIPLAIGMLIILKETPVRKFQNVFVQELIYGAAALFVVSPWLVKNFHDIGYSIFPFFCTLSFKPLNPWLSSAATGYFRGLAEYAPRSSWHLFQLLWDIAVHGLNFGGGMDVLGDLGWAPLFAFLPALWLIKKKSPKLSVILIYSVVFFVSWGMTRPVLRFLLPLAPFLVLMAAYAYEQGIHC